MQSGSDVNNGNMGVQNSPHLYYGGRGQQQQQFRGGYGGRGRGRIFHGRCGRGLIGPTGSIRRSASADVIRRDVPFHSAPMEGQRLMAVARSCIVCGSLDHYMTECLRALENKWIFKRGQQPAQTVPATTVAAKGSAEGTQMKAPN